MSKDFEKLILNKRREELRGSYEKMIEGLERALESKSVRRRRGGPYSDVMTEIERRNIPLHIADFIRVLLRKNPEFVFNMYVQMIIEGEQDKLKRDIAQAEGNIEKLKKKNL